MEEKLIKDQEVLHVDFQNKIVVCPACAKEWIYGEAGPCDGYFYNFCSPHVEALFKDFVTSDNDDGKAVRIHYCKCNVILAVVAIDYKTDGLWFYQ